MEDKKNKYSLSIVTEETKLIFFSELPLFCKVARYKINIQK